jgi:2-amino-4-hydroxy-6-hydroxymethyldihydropteridine diphosphokinase
VTSLSGLERGDGSLFRVAISLGSNLGNRQEHLDHALRSLARDFTHITSSTFVETDAVGTPPGQPAYLNAAVVGLTELSARGLLNRLLAIEKARGRERPYPMAPRTLDLDLILYGDAVIEEPGLWVPHPRFHEREFVLAPLASIAPDMLDPVSGRTIQQLLDNLPDYS